MISIKIKSLLGLSAVVFSLLFLHFSAFSADPAASKAASAVQSEKMKPLQFEATVIGVRGSAASMSTGVTIWLEATTSDEDLHEYLNLIAEKQAQGYTSQLRQRLERVSGLGRIAITGKTGTELAVVRRRQTEKGELFTLVTARNLPFVELKNGGFVITLTDGFSESQNQSGVELEMLSFVKIVQQHPVNSASELVKLSVKAAAVNATEHATGMRRS